MLGKGNLDTQEGTRSACAERKDHGTGQQYGSSLQAEALTEALTEESNPAYSLIVNFQSPELGESKFLLFKPSTLWIWKDRATGDLYVVKCSMSLGLRSFLVPMCCLIA